MACYIKYQYSSCCGMVISEKNTLVNRLLQAIQDAEGRVNENPKVRNPGTEAYTFPNDELEVRRDENKLRYENNVTPRKLPKPEQNK